MLLIAGVALLGVAVAGTVAATHDWPLWNALRRVRPTTPHRLARAARGGRLDGRVVAVSGLAGSGPGGPLRSAVNDEPCVWHRHVVHRRHVTYRTTGGGTVQRYTRRRRVADVASREPFLLCSAVVVPQPARAARADSGRAEPAVDGDEGPGSEAPEVEVRPEGMRVHRPVARGERILPGLASEPFPPAEAMTGQVGQLFWHREWLLPAGVALFVLGEVTSTGSGLALRRPARGPHVVSTRTAAWLRGRTALTVFGGLALATVGAVAGTAALIVHFV
jgi:hypothetical protein